MNISRVLFLMGGLVGAGGLVSLFSTSTLGTQSATETIRGRIESIHETNDWLPTHPLVMAFKRDNIRIKGDSADFALPGGLITSSHWTGREVEIVATYDVERGRSVKSLRTVSQDPGRSLSQQTVLKAVERDKLNKMRIGAAGVIIAAILIVAAKFLGVYARVRAGEFE